MNSLKRQFHRSRFRCCRRMAVGLAIFAVACDSGAARGEDPAVTRALASAASAAILDPCVAGTWEVADLESFHAYGELFSEEEHRDPELDLVSFKTKGTMVYAFLPGARAEIRYDLTMITSREGEDSSSGYRQVGTATTSWETQGGTLRMGPLDMTDVRISMEWDGREMLGPTPFTDLVGSADSLQETWWMGGNVSRVACRGNEMTLEVIEPGPGAEIRLRRLR